MDLVDQKQARYISLIIGGIAALSGIVAVFAYLDNKKHQNIKSEILNLDKQIKELELYHKKNGKS